MDDTKPEDALEARLRRLEDLEEIRNLYTDYGRYLDEGDAASYAALFSVTAKLRLGPIMRADGREEIEQVAADVVHPSPDGSKSSVHLLASPRIELRGDTASGECVWAAVRKGPDGQPQILVGRHLDELAREDGHWRFSLRRGVFDVGPPGTFEAPKGEGSTGGA